MSDLVLRASEWCYQGVWSVLTKWLKVTKEPPNLPSYTGQVVVQLRPSEGYLNYLKLFFWIGLTAIDGALIVLWGILFFAFPLAGILVTPLALAIIVLPDIVAYIAIHLRYDTTWYVLSDRAMRIRRGIWQIHETTITFENIQNIRTSQGPVQRHFGFSDLIVETAGGGSSQGNESAAMTGAHVGILEGLDNASQVRDMILDRLKACRSAGLGDERHEGLQHGMLGGKADAWSPADLQLLQEIRDLTARMSAR